MKKTVTNVPASVHARLLARAHREREDFNLTLQRYVAERFLYRLGASPHREQFILKGAMLLPLWGGDLYRPTKDVDLTGYASNDPTALIGIIKNICAIPCEQDGLSFEAATVRAEPIRDSSEYRGFRLRFQVRLGNAKLSFQVDVGFGDAVEPAAVERDYPTLLDGQAPRVRVYSREAVIAEKLHAMVVHGQANSRLKDFYDVYTLARRFEQDGETLTRAVVATFKRRGTALPSNRPAKRVTDSGHYRITESGDSRITEEGWPHALTAAFFAEAARQAAWAGYLTRSGVTEAPRDFGAVGEVLIAFLGRLMDGIAVGGTFAGLWRPGEGWTDDDTSNTARQNG
jgi:hypothetical protein